MKAEIVQTQSWRYKTIAVIKRQQQTTTSIIQFLSVFRFIYKVWKSIKDVLFPWLIWNNFKNAAMVTLRVFIASQGFSKPIQPDR